MRVFEDFSDIKSAVGTEIGVSDWVEVTQERINQFAEATCDEQWIHVDQKRAKKELPGGTTIAHGLLSLALAPLFIRSGIGLKGVRNTLSTLFLIESGFPSCEVSDSSILLGSGGQ